MTSNRMVRITARIDGILKDSRIRLKLGSMLLLLTAWTCSGEVCFGQLDRASLSGTVTDPSGAVVPGAQVTAIQASTQAPSSTVTNDSGVYNFIGLPIGDYSVTVEVTGFSKMVRTGVVLRTGASARVDLVLAVGTTTEQVEVTATAPLVEERSAAYGVSVETKTMNELPLQVNQGKRTPYSYLATVPGVQNAGFQNNIYGGVGMYSQVVIDGATAEYNPAVQGVMNRPPSVETLAEFKVVNSVAAEYGLSGGAFMSFATKSGTNEFHGSAFEYLRNEALDARSFFAANRAIQKQHEFGFIAGGPVYIPGLYDGRKKTFFFGSFTRFSIHSAVAGAVYTLPTPAFQNGDLSALLGAPLGTDALGRPVRAGQIYDPATTRPDGQGGVIRDPFPGNIIPSNRFSPVSAKFQAEFPQLTSPNQLTNNYVGAGGLGLNSENSTVAKIDHLLKNGRISASHRFSRAPNTTASFPLPAFFGGSIGEGRNNNVRFAYNRTFGVNAINDFIFGMDRTNSLGHSNDALANGGAKIGLKGVYIPCTPTTNIAGGYPTLSTVNCQQQEADTNWKFNDSFSTLVGKHSIKFGGSYYRWNANFPTATRANGEFFFNGLETNLPGSFGGGTGFGYASFLLGVVDTANVQATQTRGLRSWYMGYYIQDEFRVSSKLTLNYGLRYEVQPQYTNPNDNASEFDRTVPNPGAGGLLGALTFLGDGPGRNGKRRFSDIYKPGFGPRFGFAYKVLSGTVVRGSYGLFQAPVSQFSGELANRQGFVPQFGVASVDGGVTAAFNWTDGFPIGRFNPDPKIDPTIANGSSTAFIGKGNAHPAQIQMLNLSIQHELPGKLLFEAAYIGNLSHHISSGALEQWNQLDYGKYGSLGSLLTANINSAAAINAGIKSPFPGFNGTVAQALRPYPQFLGINGITSMIANSVYHAAQIKLQKHFSGGLSFLVGYTVSKTIADVDATPGFFAAGVQDAYNRKAERSLTSIDFPQDLVISYAYELPFGPGKKFLTGQDVISKHVLGGWTISGIQKYTSGAPLAITTNGRLPTTGDTLALANPTLRPNRVAGVEARTGLSCGEMNPATDRYLVRGAFANPAPFTFGNASPRLGDVRGCGGLNENLSLMKNFTMTERWRLRIGADFFNVFNRHIFGNPATNIDNLNFGTVSSASAGRSIQLNMRINW